MSSLDIGIDLGTCNMIIGTTKDGIIKKEPSVVAINKSTRKVIGVGEKAYSMIGREHSNMQLINPLEDGVISNYEMTHLLVKTLVQHTGRHIFLRPRVVTCISCNTTTVEAKSLIETIVANGAREVFLIYEPVASALGMNIDITKPMGNLLVDIGGGTCDVAVISMGGVVCQNSSTAAGNAFDESIKKHIRNQHNLLIGQHTAEKIKKQIANVWKDSPVTSMEIKGHSYISGLPQAVEISSESIYPAILEVANEILLCIKGALEHTPPELISDISENGLYLTGGGSLIKGLDDFLKDKIKIPVLRSECSTDSSINGVLKAYDYVNSDSQLFFDPYKNSY